jgi:hypothetical protein
MQDRHSADSWNLVHPHMVVTRAGQLYHHILGLSLGRLIQQLEQGRIRQQIPERFPHGIIERNVEQRRGRGIEHRQPMLVPVTHQNGIVHGVQDGRNRVPLVAYLGEQMSILNGYGSLMSYGGQQLQVRAVESARLLMLQRDEPIDHPTAGEGGREHRADRLFIIIKHVPAVVGPGVLYQRSLPVTIDPTRQASFHHHRHDSSPFLGREVLAGKKVSHNFAPFIQHEEAPL